MQTEMAARQATEMALTLALVEGQTLLRGGRYRFLRRIGSGTFSVIMRALDVRRQRQVAIKCIRQRELNVLGEREATVLRQVNGHDPRAACAVVRLHETFMERGHFCLVLELLGRPVLDVALWGPWREAPPGGKRAPSHAHKFFTFTAKRQRQRASNATLTASLEIASAGSCQTPDASSLKTEPRDAKPEDERAPPLALTDVRELAVHLCGALAFLHDQGLIHADVKPENVVRSIADASSPAPPPSCSSPVKLVDFGNCLDDRELALYAQERPGAAGFDVQTITYRAPEVAAGLTLSTAMDMWSLGCLLLECASGRPLFSLPALEHSSTSQDNSQLLLQVERVVTGGEPLGDACSAYQASECYASILDPADVKREPGTSPSPARVKEEPQTPLIERLEAAGPGALDFHDFIRRLLDVDPSTRLSARGALSHPFLQAFFPFAMVFATPSSRGRGGSNRKRSAPSAETGVYSSKKRKTWSSGTPEDETEIKAALDGPKAGTGGKARAGTTSTRGNGLREALKLIPRMPKRPAVSP